MTIGSLDLGELVLRSARRLAGRPSPTARTRDRRACRTQMSRPLRSSPCAVAPTRARRLRRLRRGRRRLAPDPRAAVGPRDRCRAATSVQHLWARAHRRSQRALRSPRYRSSPVLARQPPSARTSCLATRRTKQREDHDQRAEGDTYLAVHGATVIPNRSVRKCDSALRTLTRLVSASRCTSDPCPFRDRSKTRARFVRRYPRVSIVRVTFTGAIAVRSSVRFGHRSLRLAR